MSHDSHRMDDASLSAFAGRVRCPVTRKTVRRCKAVRDKTGAKA